MATHAPRMLAVLIDSLPARLFRQLSGIAAVPYGFRNSSDSRAIFVRAPRRA